MTVDPRSLTAEARSLIDRAEQQGRDLADFEAGYVDALLDIAQRLTLPPPTAAGSQK